MDLELEFKLLSSQLLPEARVSVKDSQKSSFTERLSPYISQLLNKDFQKLVQIMYRIDVSEKEFALTLVPSGNTDIAEALSELIYERLILKAKYRAKYKKEQNA